jgi:hypothetical protein
MKVEVAAFWQGTDAGSRHADILRNPVHETLDEHVQEPDSAIVILMWDVGAIHQQDGRPAEWRVQHVDRHGDHQHRQHTLEGEVRHRANAALAACELSHCLGMGIS